MNRFLNALTAVVVVWLVAGCGGGGNDASALPPVAEAASTASPASGASAPRPALGCDPNVALPFCPQKVVLVGTTVTVGVGRDESSTNTYQWILTKPAGSAASISDPTSSLTTFVADVPGVYHADLHLNGSAFGVIGSVTVTAITNESPVANAGPAQNAIAKNAVTLDASASFDADGDPLTYAWKLTEAPVGSTTSLGNASSARPTFTADKAGRYVWSLVVNDGYANSTPATVTVTAVSNGAPVAPVAVADAKSFSCPTSYSGTVTHYFPPFCSTDPSPVVGHEVTLDGSGSTDANGDVLTYSWTLTSKPAGSAASITSSPAKTYFPTIPFGSAFFVPDVLGTYVATLVVSDGQFDSAPVTVTIVAGGTAFSSIPSPFPVSVPGYGFEANSLKALGDRITLAPGPRTLDSIDVVMNMSACETGAPGAGGNCVTTINDGSRPAYIQFKHPITINVYDDKGVLLASRTEMFTMPYRPSADPACPDGRWKAYDGACYDGMAFRITFYLRELKVKLPDTFAFEVAYNTRTQGPTPLGVPGAYDLLSVGVYDASAAGPSVGKDPDAGFIRWNGSLADKGAGIMAEVRVTGP